MMHSTSLRATGSEMPAATAVALLAPPLRRVSIAFLTSATSASDACSAGACASGDDGGWASPVPVSPVPGAHTLTVVEALDGPGQVVGVATAVVLTGADFAFLAFAVAEDELLAPP